MHFVVNALAFAVTSLLFGCKNKTEFFLRIGLIIMSVYNFVQAIQHQSGVV